MFLMLRCMGVRRWNAKEVKKLRETLYAFIVLDAWQFAFEEWDAVGEREA